MIVLPISDHGRLLLLRLHGLHVHVGVREVIVEVLPAVIVTGRRRPLTGGLGGRPEAEREWLVLLSTGTKSVLGFRDILLFERECESVRETE